MGIIWKVYWICCLLVIASGYFIGLTLSNPTPTPTPTPTPVPSVEPTDPTTTAESEKNEKSDLDLDTQDQVAILKQINRVNEDGSYTFGYEAADGSFKIETRDVAGNVRGMFGFINEDGELKRVSYSASNGTGFQSSGTLNIPPLPGTPLSGDEDGSTGNFRHIPGKLYQQIVSPNKNKEETSTRINLLPTTINYGTPTTVNYGTPTTVNYDSTTTSTPRFPIYIYRTTLKNDVSSTAKPVVIQHIPKVRPTPASSSTEPTESEEITSKPTYGSYLPRKSSTPNYITLKSNEITSTESTTPEEPTRKTNIVQVIRPRAGPYKKVIVTKRPIDTTTPKIVTTTDYYSKEYAARLRDRELQNNLISNGVRRQLPSNNYVTGPDYTNLATSGTEDSPDVYGGGPTARPYPAAAYRMLFTQVPQHQRILQNSYIQNQNQYLAAAVNSGVPYPNINPQLPYPVQGQLPQIPPNNIPPPVNPEYQQPQPGRRPVSPGATAAAAPQYPNAPSPIPQYPNAPINPQAQIPQAPPNSQYPPPYIPPALMEQIIRMLLLAQQRRQQSISPFQQALLSTLGPGNIPPELLDNRYDNRYDPRYYQPPYPNYSQVPYPYQPPYIPNPNYDPRYQMSPYPPPYSYPPDPRFGGADPRFGGADPRLGGADPRLGGADPRLGGPDPRLGGLGGYGGYGGYGSYNPYQQRLPYDIDPRQQQQNEDSFLLRMLLSSRYPQQEPNPQIQNSPNTVERSPVYGQRIPDSTTSPTTSKPRFSSVRNVQILDPINESTESSTSFVRNIKSKSK